MTPGPGQESRPPPDHARAETYLRLRVEAELRRVQALPRPDLLAESGIPAPLRGVARLVLPLGERAASAAQTLRPYADSAARTLQPLAGNASRALQPLAGNASRAVQPLAGSAARALQPLAGQLAGTVLPVADQAARRLHMLGWRASVRLRRWPYRVPAVLRSVAAGGPAEPAELSPEEGVDRFSAVAHALAWAGAIDPSTAESVVASLETALAARSRIHPNWLWRRIRRGMRQAQTAGPPAGSYLAAPVGVTASAAPDSGLGHIHLMTMVIAPDRALLVVSGQVTDPDARSVHRDPWPVFGGAGLPAAADDRGNAYQLHHDGGWSNDQGEWGGTLRISPVPPAGIRWLELTMSPGSAPVRVDLTGAGGERAPRAEPAGSPAGHLIDTAVVDLLAAAIGHEDGEVPWHDLSQTAEIVTALDAVGALEPARPAAGQLITLAGRLGVHIPPGLRAAVSPRDLPAAWADVLDNRSRQDGPAGLAPAAVVLPELDGTRFVLAGLRSGPAGAELHVLAWGRHLVPGLIANGGITPWSWWARDDQGRWHILTEGSCSAGDLHADLQLEVKPPLHPAATSLEVTLAGRSGQVTATIPLPWQESR